MKHPRLTRNERSLMLRRRWKAASWCRVLRAPWEVFPFAFVNPWEGVGVITPGDNLLEIGTSS